MAALASSSSFSAALVETVRWRYDGKALHIEPLSPQGYDIVFWGAYTPWRQIG